MNKILTTTELERSIRQCCFLALVDVGFLNPLFIENQYNYERAEFDI